MKVLAGSVSGGLSLPHLWRLLLPVYGGKDKHTFISSFYEDADALATSHAAPLLSTTPLGVKFQHTNFWGTQTLKPISWAIGNQNKDARRREANEVSPLMTSACCWEAHCWLHHREDALKHSPATSLRWGDSIWNLGDLNARHSTWEGASGMSRETPMSLQLNTNLPSVFSWILISVVSG